MLILPDSSCWIEFFRPRGDPEVQEAIRGWLSADQVGLCGPVRAEVLRGARKNEVTRIRNAFEALHYLETRDGDWGVVADKARALSDTGRHVPLLDLLISAIATRHKATIAHKDEHFDTITTVVSLSACSFL